MHPHEHIHDRVNTPAPHVTHVLLHIPVDSVINQQRHNKELKENSVRISKYPPAFGIDVHIDDSIGLKIEGERFNFKTIIVAENDKAWVQMVLDI